MRFPVTQGCLCICMFKASYIPFDTLERKKYLYYKNHLHGDLHV